MWKLGPDTADSIDDSTEGNGGISDRSGGGGVSVFCSGEAVYEWRCDAKKGGRDVLLFVKCGEYWGDGGTCDVSPTEGCTVASPTGVRSRLSSSVADAAASMRSSHRLPISWAAVDGSAEKAFRS